MHPTNRSISAPGVALLSLLMKGKAEQIENNGKEIYTDLPLPTVIRLRSYVKIPYKEISLSRRNILHRDNYICQYCGDKRHDLTIDHIIPRSRGGLDSWDNVAAACLRCNVKKATHTQKKLVCRSTPHLDGLCRMWFSRFRSIVFPAITTGKNMSLVPEHRF
jgi:5-methylcytosine-specific restriction endonuclease McrA